MAAELRKYIPQRTDVVDGEYKAGEAEGNLVYVVSELSRRVLERPGVIRAVCDFDTDTYDDWFTSELRKVLENDRELLGKIEGDRHLRSEIHETVRTFAWESYFGKQKEKPAGRRGENVGSIGRIGSRGQKGEMGDGGRIGSRGTIGSRGQKGEMGDGGSVPSGLHPSWVAFSDSQGNPVNADGTLRLERIKSVDELTDVDFSKPYRNVELPELPLNIDAAIGANGKPVIIKKNVFEKNWNAHKFPFDESRAILKAALYDTDLVGRSQPTKRPLHWVAIKLDEKSPIVVLEVNESKDNVEIVGWYTLDERNLGRIKRQAEKNGGELVMLSPKDKVESLSTPLDNLSSDGKGSANAPKKQARGRKVGTSGRGKPSVEDIADNPKSWVGLRFIWGNDVKAYKARYI